MKILVTVGTTRFDKLIKQIASISALPHMANNFFMCQKANGLSNPETEITRKLNLFNLLRTNILIMIL